MEMTWQDPPSSGRRGRPLDPEWDPFLEALKAFPGRWALYPRTKHRTFGIQRMKLHPGLEHVGSKADPEGLPHSRSKFWFRYVPEVSSE